MENKDSAFEKGVRKDITLDGLYENWFLDYASYVILERAVPILNDGFKPVQRRIMHSMKEMDDGRFNKVANIIGSTMQYHPHGDASIGDAIVNIGQKDLLIDTQGNWGDVRTGDSAAAPRYIEARLSKFANDVLFSPKITEWQTSYDGRKKEPVTLPVKFPLLLVQGVEGIAVGLATKILPHNFCELIDATIKYLKGKPFELYPDFATGGQLDVSNYNEGLRGGKIRARAEIEVADSKTLLIKSVPFGSTTSSMMDSIVKANDQGKIKIKKVTDNTAKDVEVEVQLQNGQSPDVTIDALYAFTDAEISISPNACVIIDDKPHFLPVSEMLKLSTDHSKEMLRQELEIKRAELMERLLFSSLEKIFIENRIYRDIEEATTFEQVIEIIDQGLEPFKPQFYREITRDDILRLTEIRIKRISKYDSFKADELMKNLEADLEQTIHHLANLVDFTINYFKDLLKKYGKGRERKSTIATFDTISVAKVAANNAKLYVDKANGFIGYGLKKDEFVQDCSDLDDIIVFRKDGKCLVTKIQDKSFVGKGIIHVEVFHKNDERKVYNLIYSDGKTGITRAKRFNVLTVTRDREYDLTTGNPNCKVLYFTANSNGEAESVTISLSPNSKAKVKKFEYDFAELEIKGRGAQGNIVTKYPVRKVALKAEGKSTLGAVEIYYDEAVGRLNKDGVGSKLGKFREGDQIVVIHDSGEYELTNFDLTNRYDPAKTLLIQKFDEKTAFTAVYRNGRNKEDYIKLFQIETNTPNKRFLFITEESGSKLHYISTDTAPEVLASYKLGRKKEVQQFKLNDFAELKGWKALGNKSPVQNIVEVTRVAKGEEAEKNQMKLF